MEDDLEDNRGCLLFYHFFLTVFLRWHCCQLSRYFIVAGPRRIIHVVSHFSSEL